MIDFHPSRPEYRCGHCGLVHYAVTPKRAMANVIADRRPIVLGSAATRATLLDYMLCARCQLPTSQFVLAEQGDAADGDVLPACVVPERLWRQSEAMRSFDEEAQVNV